jgi:hypothetical protein
MPWKKATAGSERTHPAVKITTAGNFNVFRRTDSRDFLRLAVALCTTPTLTALSTTEV